MCEKCGNETCTCVPAKTKLTKQEELKGLLEEVMGTKVQDALDAAEEKQEERNKAIETMTSDLKADIEAFKNLPAQTRTLVDPTSGHRTEVNYKGYDMSVQGAGLYDRMQDHAVKLSQDYGREMKITDLAGRPVVSITDDEKRERYAKFLIDLITNPRPPHVKAAMQEDTAAEGGYLVPDEYTAEILAFARLQSLALQQCRVWPMSTDVRRVPAEDGAVSVAWTAEEDATTESEPTVAEVVLTAKRLDAYSKVSNELLQDSAVDIVSWLTELFSEAIGQELDNQVFNGTGDPCSGIFTAVAGLSVLMTSGLVSWSSITVDYLSEVLSKVPVNRLAGARWFLHRDAMHYIRTLKDTANNPIFANPGQGVPGTIFEYPYSISEAAPARSGAETDTCMLVFGNLRYFALGRRLQSMTLDVDPYGLFVNYQTRFRIVNRWGAQIGLAGGFCRLLTQA